MSWNNCNNISNHCTDYSTPQNCCWTTTYYNSCNPCNTNSSNIICCNPCNPPTTPPPNPCPTIFYSASTGVPISVPSGGMDIPPGTIIPTGSTVVPAGTVTLINVYNNLISLQGNIIVSNGFFTVPCRGQYLITATASFDPAVANITSDYRNLYIYKVNNTNGLVTLVAETSAAVVTSTPTIVNLSFIADLSAHDRIFIAVRQTNGGTVPINLNGNSRVAIKRLC